jgi:hypothetical protein
MPLKKLPYKKIQSLIGIHLTTKEYPAAGELIKKLKTVKKRGYIKKSELELICRWKSARSIRHIERNNPGQIKNRTSKALKTRSEKLKIELLTSLLGVSIPMASAILTLIDPKRYGVIDIRVWQLLHKMKTVSGKPCGVGFSFNNWYQYLMIIRYFAKVYNVTARDIDRTLFRVHALYQKGNLYKNF